MLYQALPDWARLSLQRRHAEDISGDWIKDSDEVYYQVLHIVYPTPGGVHYVVDRLEENGWKELEGTHYIPQTARAAAEKRAYFDRVPHRIREVVWSK